MNPEDRLLLGVDLRKEIARIELAYNDSQGVTAAFNRNILRRMSQAQSGMPDVVRVGPIHIDRSAHRVAAS